MSFWRSVSSCYRRLRRRRSRRKLIKNSEGRADPEQLAKGEAEEEAVRLRVAREPVQLLGHRCEQSALAFAHERGGLHALLVQIVFQLAVGGSDGSNHQPDRQAVARERPVSVR